MLFIRKFVKTDEILCEFLRHDMSANGKHAAGQHVRPSVHVYVHMLILFSCRSSEPNLEG